MATKQAKAAQSKAAPIPELPGKVRFEVRFDEDVYTSVKKVADQAQISVNQLMHALARWAGQHCHVGEPVRMEDGFVTGETKPQPGCVWAGEPGVNVTLSGDELRRAHEEFCEEENINMPLGLFVSQGLHQFRCDKRRGRVWLFFDFTERRVLRED